MEAMTAFSTLAISILAGLLLSEMSYILSQIQILILYTVLNRYRQRSWAMRCSATLQEIELAYIAQVYYMSYHMLSVR